MPPVISASPPDLSSIITSLAVFSLAVAAVVGGIYKGLKEIRRGGADTGKEVAAAVIVENATMIALTESNRELAEIMRGIERLIDKAVDALHDNRDRTRSLTEENHRLRVAVTDLHEHMRRTR